MLCVQEVQCFACDTLDKTVITMEVRKNGQAWFKVTCIRCGDHHYLEYNDINRAVTKYLKENR
jgi:RNase P subunit RPR2